MKTTRPPLPLSPPCQEAASRRQEIAAALAPLGLTLEQAVRGNSRQPYLRWNLQLAGQTVLKFWPGTETWRCRADGSGGSCTLQELVGLAEDVLARLGLRTPQTASQGPSRQAWTGWAWTDDRWEPLARAESEEKAELMLRRAVQGTRLANVQLAVTEGAMRPAFTPAG